MTIIENYSLDISPNKYWLLYYVYNKKEIDIEKYEMAKDLNDLIKNDYIKKEGKDYVLKGKGLRYFEMKNTEELFQQLWDIYPITVIDEKNRIRRIRIDRETCWKLYRLIITSKEQHNQVLIALKKELLERTNNNTMGFMVELSRYIRRKRWESYMEEGGVIGRTGYNQRKL